MPRESSSAPTLEAGVPETSSHSSIASKFASGLRIECAVFVRQIHIMPGKCLPLSFIDSWKYGCVEHH